MILLSSPTSQGIKTTRTAAFPEFFENFYHPRLLRGLRRRQYPWLFDIFNLLSSPTSQGIKTWEDSASFLIFHFYHPRLLRGLRRCKEAPGFFSESFYHPRLLRGLRLKKTQDHRSFFLLSSPTSQGIKTNADNKMAFSIGFYHPRLLRGLRRDILSGREGVRRLLSSPTSQGIKTYWNRCRRW